MSEPKGKPASLQDLINYTPDAYFSPEEIALIQNTFKDIRVLKVLRKILLPSIGDPELPLEQIQSDVWLQGRDWGSIADAEIKPVILGRQEAIKFISGALIQLRVLANGKPETNIEESFRRSKDSAE